MTRWINLAAVVFILLGNLLFWPQIIPKKRPAPERIELKNGQVIYKDAPVEEQKIPWFAISLWAIGSATLFVDAIRRPRGPSSMSSVVCTSSGIILFGAPALLYYAMIGWRPVGQTDRVFGRGFCRQCLASTSNESAGNLFTLNFLYGTRFLGSSHRCNACGSVVRTKWLCFGMPLIPQGSYRVVWVEHNRFLSRKTGLDMKQVYVVWGITAAVVIVALILTVLMLPVR